jgi:hypothetical protein
VDELLDLIFKIRTRRPREYPINTPHLFTHKITCTQQDRDEELCSHKPYAGFAYRENLARSRGAKSWIDRTFKLDEHVDQTEAVEGKPQLGDTEGEEAGHPSAHHEVPLVTGQPVASSSGTPTYEQPHHLAEYQQEKLSPLLNPSHLTFHEVPNQGELVVILG